jgi:hypothetical protein
MIVSGGGGTGEELERRTVLANIWMDIIKEVRNKGFEVIVADGNDGRKQKKYNNRDNWCLNH